MVGLLTVMDCLLRTLPSLSQDFAHQFNRDQVVTLKLGTHILNKLQANMEPHP